MWTAVLNELWQKIFKVHDNENMDVIRQTYDLPLC